VQEGERGLARDAGELGGRFSLHDERGGGGWAGGVQETPDDGGGDAERDVRHDVVWLVREREGEEVGVMWIDGRGSGETLAQCCEEASVFFDGDDAKAGIGERGCEDAVACARFDDETARWQGGALDQNARSAFAEEVLREFGSAVGDSRIGATHIVPPAAGGVETHGFVRT
jgi:hypothetical protein